MKQDNCIECCKEKVFAKHQCCHGGGVSSPIYCLSVIGALFYFLKGAATFGTVMIGIGKAIFGPPS